MALGLYNSHLDPLSCNYIRASGLCRNDRNGNMETETETQKVLCMLTSTFTYSGPYLWCYLRSCLLRVYFCSCSVW